MARLSFRGRADQFTRHRAELLDLGVGIAGVPLPVTPAWAAYHEALAAFDVGGAGEVANLAATPDRRSVAEDAGDLPTPRIPARPGKADRGSMTKEALRSRMGARVRDALIRRGEYPMPAEILRLSTAQMADILVAEGLWEVFTEQFPLVRIGDDFYDRDGKVV